ncbi:MULTISPECIES: polymorphic toxin type 47 domain-containing protein [Brevibacillus]|jgi:Bacterial toxin 47|uniref:polymorphic toxin type 47 domain-containing protein n=1 Tax=Brevibacillus TaxID=55080 RepID=UPI0030CF8779
MQTVKKTAPVRAVAGFTRKAGTQISQGFRQIGSAISRSLATTVLRSKTAGAVEGFAVSVMDDRARGKKVDYRKATIAAAIGALLVTGGSIGLNKAYSTGQETAQAVVKSGAEQAEDSLKAVLRGEGTGDPYDLLRQHGVPTTLTDEEIAAARAVDLRMELKGTGEDLTGNNWKFDPEKDVDLRGSGKTYKDGLDEAFKRTGLSRDQFTVTKWGKDINGKSVPVEWSGPGGASVTMDIPEWNNVKPNGALGEGPHQPHIGYQTPGKGANRIRGHIFIDDVPATRR